MAGRIRSLKPEILEDEKTAALSNLEWRLFVSLFLIADDYGNLRGDPAYVRGQVLWATGESRETVGEALGTLSGLSLLSRYTVRGQSYYHISGWDKHQKVEKPGKPRMPGPDQSDPDSLCVITVDSRESREESPGPRETLSPDLRSPISDLRPEYLSPARAIPPTTVPAPSPGPVPSLDSIWSELEIERQRVAIALSISVQPLLAHDPGRADLASLLAEAARSGARHVAVGQARHAIAAAGAEAVASRDTKWLTGAIFTPNNLRRLVGMSLEEAQRPRDGPGARTNGARNHPDPPRGKTKIL